MNATVYLLVRIAWVVGKVLMQYVKEKQAVLTPEERKAWNEDWSKKFFSGE